MDDTGFSTDYEDYFRTLNGVFLNSVFYDRMLTMYDELLDGEPIEYYEGTEFYDSLSESCYAIENYLSGSLWQTVNEADSRIEAMLPSDGGIWLGFDFIYEKCGLSWDIVKKVNLSDGVLREYSYLDMKYFWENGYLEEDFTPVYIYDYQWDEDMNALDWQLAQESLNMLSKIAPDYLEQTTGRADFAEYVQNINSFNEFFEYYPEEEYWALIENIPSLEELVMNYPGMNYAAEFGGVETPYDADVEKAEEKLRTLENEKAELEEELLEVQELAADATRYENNYDSNKQESFTTFVLSAVSAAAAGLLLTFAISCLLIFADYLKKRKTMFQIQYAGGCIAFDVSFYAKAEIEDFQKQLRRTKDHVADTATVKTVTVNAPAEAPAQTNVPDELRKYAELLKEGLISQEEYDAMKKKLLGL